MGAADCIVGSSAPTRRVTALAPVILDLGETKLGLPRAVQTALGTVREVLRAP